MQNTQIQKNIYNYKNKTNFGPAKIQINKFIQLIPTSYEIFPQILR